VTERGRRPLVSLVRARATIFVFVAMWLAGLTALGVAISFQARVDTQRQAEVVMGTMQRQVGNLAAVAFDPATSALNAAPTAAQTTRRMRAGQLAIRESVATLRGLDGSGEPARIVALDGRYFLAIDRISSLVAQNKGQMAALEFGRESLPTGSYGALLAELRRVGGSYSHTATRSRFIGAFGTVAATLLLLLAFSITLYRATRLAREKHQLLERSSVEALTDALTGLPNRRKLFTDMADLLRASPTAEGFALGMFDLDGFKTYNDTFGHPAGDALLARCGHKLAAAMEGHGSAYRMGGDEFCVIVRGADSDRVLVAAAEALSEHGEHFDVRCSSGSVVIRPNEMTLEQALLQADQRLYTNKRSSRGHAGGEAHDVLLSVLAEHSLSLATHLSHVGTLAEAVARKLGLAEDAVLLTRLAAELHDVGKTAIPDVVLNKPGPLDDDEWALLKRHTIIGERILAAAPALARVAPLIRSMHERVDGAGYPDGLLGDAIPLSSRIVCVVDAYDAMTTGRPYRVERPAGEAIAELQRCTGSQFDAVVVEAFVTVCRESSGNVPRRGAVRLAA
jgi:diguanylate cyclase (GGDEF)-like protein